MPGLKDRRGLKDLLALKIFHRKKERESGPCCKIISRQIPEYLFSTELNVSAPKKGHLREQAGF